MTTNNVLDRLTSMLPVEDLELFELYQQAKRTYWTEDEVDISNDVVQWNTKLTNDQKTFLSHVLGFFVQSDQLVNINLEERFVKDITTIPNKYAKYARLFYNFQTAMEDIHTLSYETMLNEFISDPVENEYFKNAISRIPAISKKAKWAAKYIDDYDSTFATRLIAFAILEGIFFSGSFCSIFWIESKNLLRGLAQYNKFISRDENLHYQFALTLFKKLRDDHNYDFEINNEQIIEMVTGAVIIENEFINESIPCDMIGMNSNLMTKYIHYIADQLFIDIDLPPFYNEENPFPFMVALGLVDKSNFFEARETVYQKPAQGVIEYDSDNSDF